jgi:hypothetical protein
MPPRPGDGLPDGREPGDPGAIQGRMSARDHPAGRAPTGGRAPERRGGIGRCDPGSRWRRRVQLPGASVPWPAITLSDTGGQGERAQSRPIWTGRSTAALGHERAHIRRICAPGRTRAWASSESRSRRSALPRGASRDMIRKVLRSDGRNRRHLAHEQLHRLRRRPRPSRSHPR